MASRREPSLLPSRPRWVLGSFTAACRQVESPPTTRDSLPSRTCSRSPNRTADPRILLESPSAELPRTNPRSIHEAIASTKARERAAGEGGGRRRRRTEKGRKRWEEYDELFLAARKIYVSLDPVDSTRQVSADFEVPRRRTREFLDPRTQSASSFSA